MSLGHEQEMDELRQNLKGKSSAEIRDMIAQHKGQKKNKKATISLAKKQAKRIGVSDHRIILNAVDSRKTPDDYTGWVKEMNGNGQIKCLFQARKGKLDGLAIWYNVDGTEKARSNYKDGKPVD